MLSSQTKDEVTGKAMQQLKELGLTVSKINSLSEEEVAKLIYPVGFWKVIVKHYYYNSEYHVAILYVCL